MQREDSRIWSLESRGSHVREGSEPVARRCDAKAWSEEWSERSNLRERAPQRTPSPKGRPRREAGSARSQARRQRAMCGGSGFTLMELLVSLALFAITTGLIADLFILASRQHQRISAAARVHGDARLILETIVREVRQGALEYSAERPRGVLSIRDAEGRPLRFARSTTGCPPDVTACIRIARDLDGNGEIVDTEWAPLTSGGVEVTAFEVRAAPDRDPFAWDAVNGTYGAHEQPRVTLRLSLASRGARSSESVVVEAQTTVVSRVYRR